jgi:hypothetical protein
MMASRDSFSFSSAAGRGFSAAAGQAGDLMIWISRDIYQKSCIIK